MRKRFLIGLLLVASFCSAGPKAFSQQHQCYCFENSETEFTEWLCFGADSVIVVGFSGKTCGDGIDKDTWGHAMRGHNILWGVNFTEEGAKFTKVLKEETFGITLRYIYTCTAEDEGLNVHIEYAPASLNFTDRTGPPDRYYHLISAEDTAPLKDVFMME